MTRPPGRRCSSATRSPTGNSSTQSPRPACTAVPRAPRAGHGASTSPSSRNPGRPRRRVTAPACVAAATERGICSVALGDDDAGLVSALRREYPRAELEASAADLADAVRAIVEHLEGKRVRMDLPFDIQASAFQLRVWRELQRIPYGSTRSYSSIATAIGAPSAVRAVAR